MLRKNPYRAATHGTNQFTTTWKQFLFRMAVRRDDTVIALPEGAAKVKSEGVQPSRSSNGCGRLVSSKLLLLLLVPIALGALHLYGFNESASTLSVHLPSRSDVQSNGTTHTHIGTESNQKPDTACPSPHVIVSSPVAHAPGARANCECLDAGDGGACNDPLPPSPLLSPLRTAGRGGDQCAHTEFLPPYANAGRQRNTSWPFVACDTFREIADHVWDTPDYGCPVEPEKIECGDIVYTHTADFVFEGGLHSAAKHPFILISCGSDYSIPLAVGTEAMFHPQRKPWAWYGMNLLDRSPYHRYLPIGVEGRGWPSGNVDLMTAAWPLTADALKVLWKEKLRKYLAGEWPEDKVVFVAFTVSTNAAERNAALSAINSNLQLSSTRVAPEHYHKALTEYVFVVAPMGNGFDSHRQWEAINAYTIPIMRLEQQQHMGCLPAVFLRQWVDITWSFLKAAAREIFAEMDGYDLRRGFADYHIARLRREQQRARDFCAANPSQ